LDPGVLTTEVYYPKKIIFMKKIFLRISLVAITSCVIFPACKKDDPIAPSSPTTNKPPTARAGSDVIVTLPANSVLLDGSASGDADGTIDEYYWSYLSGPADANISNPTNLSTEIRFVTEGVYEFKLTVIDNRGYASNDTVKIFVVYPEFENEVIFENLTWKAYYDPDFMDSDLYIDSPPVPRSNLASLFRVFVKTAFSPDWVEAKTIINGQFSSPFTYFAYVGGDPAYIHVSSFPWDGRLDGTIASLKINY
jgi:hypothetical protein